MQKVEQGKVLASCLAALFVACLSVDQQCTVNSARLGQFKPFHKYRGL